MFEQVFNNVENILRNEKGTSTELDRVEQISWVLFLKYLDDLDLGPEFGLCEDARGEIRFIDGPMPGSNCRWVEVGDLLSVSLLQNRLNELGENVSLEVGGEFN